MAKLDEFTDHMRYQWWIHGHINFVLLSSSAFCDLYDKVMEPERAHRVVPDAAGLPHPLGRRAAGPVGPQPDGQGQPRPARSCSAPRRPPRCSTALDETDEGRAFRRKLDEFLFEFGWRSDAVYDLADIPWREDPSIPLASVAALMELDDSEDPELLYQRQARPARSCWPTLRAKLADDPETLSEVRRALRAGACTASR